MRAFVVVLVLTVALMAVAAGAQETPPLTPPPQEAPVFEAQPPQPFPAGAKVAFVNFQRIAAESAEGQAATAKVQALNEQKVAELNQKNTQLQAAQQKLAQSAALLSDQARLQLEREIERMQVDIQRFTQDAQIEVQDLQQELQDDFQTKLFPVIQEICEEMDLHMLFSQIDSGLIWANMGLDITDDIIRRFDRAVGASAGGDAGPAASNRLAPGGPAAPGSQP